MGLTWRRQAPSPTVRKDCVRVSRTNESVSFFVTLDIRFFLPLSACCVPAFPFYFLYGLGGDGLVGQWVRVYYFFSMFPVDTRVSVA